VVDLLSKAKVIGKNHQRPLRGESLFELDGAEGVGFCADELAKGIAGRSLAFLITADGVTATGKEPFVEG
jgi:hypothetical protein